jgi:outer membrane receptor for ferrienterochelin and colicins
VFGFVRDRKPFDANNDSFSELASIENTSIGARAFHRFGHRSKLTFDFFNILEDRRGGDKHDYLLHESTIAEAVQHNIKTGALTFDQFFRETDLFSVFASAQYVDRGSYYGANQSLSDYGHTTDLTYTVGSQYRLQLKGTGIIFGVENVNGRLLDKKLGYADYENAVNIDDVIHTDNIVVADQSQNITGAFTQIDYTYHSFKTTAGIRYDHYNISDVQNPGNEISGNVLSPRITVMYDFSHHMQARLSFAKGYRAPQIFDEDLHIETSRSRKVVHENAPGLKQETSYSFMGSLDFNFQIGKAQTGLLIEGFHTRLDNPFANEYGDPDADGVVIYTRVNAEEGAVVAGVNSELTLIPSSTITLRSGFTVQQSKYKEAREFNERRYFRTPNTYGFFTADWKPIKKMSVSATGTYTGKMLVPYFGLTIAEPEEGELRESNTFFDLGLKLAYDIKVNGATLQVFGGVKNLLNSYQNDFDLTADRDPGYMYGPNQPRMVYFGLRIGNRLK